MTEQVEIPGTEKQPKKKRRTIWEQAVAGDLLVAFRPGAKAKEPTLVAVEQVPDGGFTGLGQTIYDRWVDQGIIADGRIVVEVWEQRGSHFRKRKAGR